MILRFASSSSTGFAACAASHCFLLAASRSSSASSSKQAADSGRVALRRFSSLIAASMNSASKGRGRGSSKPQGWVPKACLNASARKEVSAAQVSVSVEETAYPVKKGAVKVKSQIKATFYPKFENEKSDQEIRQKMIDVVSEGRGALEISLKHSGSLFMYSGDGNAFAKNSYGNLYTAVGVYVLGKSLERAWEDKGREMQRRFNAHLKERYMCICMELVTAVLGDHGQRPLMDYVVVTAVSELRGRPRFYSTAELVEFCRQWRLPTNQTWLCSSRKSAAACFAAYDVFCESGIYSTVTANLDKVADFTVPGTESHSVVQGEILEGLVARIVSPESVQRLKRVHEQHPVPSHPPGRYTAPGLREICSENRQSEQQQVKALLQAVGPDFCSTYDEWFKKSKDESTFFNKFISLPPADDSTEKLQSMIKLLRNKRMKVRFKCQANGASENDFRMTIHVLQDSVFRRYQKEMQNNGNLWPLYRGFFVDVKVTRDENTVASAENSMSEMTLGDPSQDALADDAQNLMVKLKFLCYKIRTFLIRNGMQILFTRGHQAYKEYYLRQMQIWNTSPQKQRELSQLLDEWAVYITGKYKTGRLREGSFLSEAEPFLKQFAARSPKNQALVGQAGTSISTEDFIALTRDEEDEEGDLKQEVPASSVPPLSKIEKKGMLVFFPGIPGCAKSALCKEILNSKDGLGDGRPLKSLMGDMIKGRYWPKLTDERRKNPRVVTLADKNAPNDEVWKTIADICEQTDALGVPVVPESEGTDSNPFSLDLLSVFIFRVLHREKHPGNLDKNSPYAGYVLLMFYNLYDGKDWSEFETDLTQRFGCLVKIPVLKADRPPLPSPLKAVLQEGLDLFQKHQSKHGKADPAKGSYKLQWDEWESKLRSTLFAHSKYLNQIQVPFEEAVKAVKEQLRGVASGTVQVTVPKKEESKLQAFSYAAVSLPVDSILAALQNLASSNPQAKAYLAPKNLDKAVRAAHVTLAHIRSHGVPAVAEYGGSVGSEVPVHLTALLCSPQLCALEAKIDSDEIKSKNPWPHATLWTAPGVPPKEAGSLGALEKAGKANRIEFPQPVAVTGTVRFMR